MNDELGPDGFEDDPRYGTRRNPHQRKTPSAEADWREKFFSAIGELDRLQDALRAIRGPQDEGYWIEVYREAGGGYVGLQAIASAALAGPAGNRLTFSKDDHE